MGRIFIVVLCVCLFISVCSAAEPQPLADQMFRDSYSLGYEFGASVKGQEIAVDIDVLLSAARDALEGRKGALSSDEIRNVLRDMRQKVMIAQERRSREQMAKTLAEGKAFLEANRAKEGVRTLPSGLQYLVLREGNGPTPKAADIVKVHYRGMLTDGTEFDSSYDRGEPAIFRANSMIRGWTEALQLMRAGSEWKIFVPTELAYGKRQFGRIPSNSALIFDIELLAVGDDLVPKVPEPKPMDPLPSPVVDQPSQHRAGEEE